MDKPITIVKEEFETKLVALVNDYSMYLPAFVTRMVIKNVDTALKEVEQAQLDNDRKAYENEQAKVESESEGE